MFVAAVSSKPSMFSSSFKSGGQADAPKTIASAVKAREDDDRYKDFKPIIRELYVAPPKTRTVEELADLRAKMGDVKVYPYNDGSSVKITEPYTSFEEAFSNNADILREIKKNGFEKPSAIQSQMWSTLLSGIDCVGVSQTGSGKTLAFLLPAFLHIDAQYRQYQANEAKPRPSVLVLTPTRELAQQIQREVEKYSYNGYRSVCVYGGGDRREQLAAVQKGVEIIIATPGRLTDFYDSGIVDLSRITYTVLDEADRMLDLGFEPSIRRIMFEVRPDRLVALTSFTWPESVRELAGKYTKDGIMVVVGTLDLTSCKSVRQFVEVIEPDDKLGRILEIVAFLTEEHKDDFKVIIFVRSKALADDLSSDFCIAGISAEALHGGRSQENRENSLEQLRSGSIKRVLAKKIAECAVLIRSTEEIMNSYAKDGAGQKTNGGISKEEKSLAGKVCASCPSNTQRLNTIIVWGGKLRKFLCLPCLRKENVILVTAVNYPLASSQTFAGTTTLRECKDYFNDRGHYLNDVNSFGTIDGRRGIIVIGAFDERTLFDLGIEIGDHCWIRAFGLPPLEPEE